MKRLRTCLLLSVLMLCLPLQAWSASVQAGVAVDAVTGCFSF